MKAVMKSVSPRICEKVANGNCTILVSKTAPKCEVPFKCYIYATKAKKWFRSGIIITSNELLWLSSGKIKMCDGFELWADGEDYQCVNGKVIGEFICDKVDKIIPLQHTYYNYIGLPIANVTEYGIWNDDLAQMCLKKKEIDNYGKGKMLYGWHISDLKIYDKPKELREFYIACKEKSCQMCDAEREYDVCAFGRKKPITRAPQSWQYVEGLEK